MFYIFYFVVHLEVRRVFLKIEMILIQCIPITYLRKSLPEDKTFGSNFWRVNVKPQIYPYYVKDVMYYTKIIKGTSQICIPVLDCYLLRLSCRKTRIHRLPR